MSYNYYEILGIETNASTDEIKRAYRRLSLIYHPDKNNNDTDKSIKFKTIGSAYETLIDNISRNKYDRENNIINNCNTSNTDYSNTDYSKTDYSNTDYSKTDFHNHVRNDIRNHMRNDLRNHVRNDNYIDKHRLYNINAMPRRYDIYDIENRYDIDNNYDIDNRHDRHNMYDIPKPLEIVKHVNFNQSYYGDNIPIFITRDIYINRDHYTETETIYIDIDPGTDNNEIITVEKKGNIYNNISGDIKIKIILDNNPIFKRNGLDLIYVKNISFKESVCGFTFALKHINGKSYTINNNTGLIIHPNYNTSIPKLGFKKNNNIGNLIINYNIDYPDKLNKDIITKLQNIL